MTITYNGKNYNGWQKQKNATTIQSVLEDAVNTVIGERVDTVASGRTDSGVNAYQQVLHFDTQKSIRDFNKFKRSLNGVLPHDIKALFVTESSIHARFDVVNKTYLYKLYISDVELPLMSDALCLSPNIDVDKMEEFIKLLKGQHDFKGFQATGATTETTVRTIYSARLVREDRYLNFYVKGNGFLYKMVRNIVGTMVAVGEGKIDLADLKNIIFTEYKSKHTAKPEYLYLYNVQY